MGVSERTLQRMRTEGRIPYIRLTGKLFRYDAADCDAFIQGCRTTEPPHDGSRPGHSSHNVQSRAKPREATGFMARREARRAASR